MGKDCLLGRYLTEQDANPENDGSMMGRTTYWPGLLWRAYPYFSI